MEKERPTELNKKIKRLRSSRDKLKDRSREKTLDNKKLRDRNVEIETSRDFWKKQCKDLCKEHLTKHEALMEELKASQDKLEQERMQVSFERERAKKLEEEIEKIREKKSGS
jgi:hypothetical protein